MSPVSRTLAGLALATALSTTVAAQGLVTQKNISLAMAQTIAQAALAQCESMGFKVAVTVVDRGGLPIVMLRGDGAGLHTPEGCRAQGLHRAHVQPALRRLRQADDGETGECRLAAVHSRTGARRRTADQGRQRSRRRRWRLRLARQG